MPDPQNPQETKLLLVSLHTDSLEPQQLGGWFSTELATYPSADVRKSQLFLLQNIFYFLKTEPPYAGIY